MAARDKAMEEDEIKALVTAEIRDAELYFRDDVVQNRERAINYYNGEMPDTPAADGWSTFKSRDVSDVMGWVLPGIIRVFSASDRMVNYEPRRPGDEQFTDQASDYANYIFWVDNNGYRILWDATHDSLLLADGIVKTYWDDSEECEYSVHSGLTAEQVMLLTDEEGVEITAQGEGEPYVDVDPMTGEQVEIQTYDVKIKRVTMQGRLRVETVEPENFLVDRNAISIADARFVCHRDPHVTRSKLIEMGFDKSIVDSIPRYTFGYSQLSEEATARDPNVVTDNIGDKSMDRVELYECYVKADVNGDGIAETVLVYYAGGNGAGTLLDWEIWDDDLPFSQIPCEPVPHRFVSRSLAGEVMDVQQIKTVLFRQMLNNLYQVNNPQKDIEAGSVLNMNELVNPTIGGVLIRKAGSQPIKYNVVPSIFDSALAGIQAMDNVTEMRTGVSRATMALDPMTLQNQTATASQNQRDSAYSQIELIARNQAELGWKDVFAKILRLIVKHQDRPRTIRLRDQWVDMDPRQWNAGMDAVINVGLGTGSRDRDMSMLNMILQSQMGITDRFQASGMTQEALDMVPRIKKTLVKQAEAAGIRNGDDFYPEITPERLQQIAQQQADAAQQPDPKVAADMAKSQADMELKRESQRQDTMLKQEQIRSDATLKREEMAIDGALKREQLNKEIQLKREQLAAELALKRDTAVLGAAVKGASASSEVHVGGEPG
ncbi:portal protein [Ensifer adhaerens]|uniref:portal protein n=1 Tax=Ensifer adhaerens TaxID=106592 RepID=UPI000CF185CC|nr:hypothetical protein [Ensifer adhaerens]